MNPIVTIGRSAGIQVSGLTPLTTVLVWTTNSLYRIVVNSGSDVYIQGGAFFPDPTPVRVDGAGVRGAVLKTGWIVVGLVMEIQNGATRIVTSPVRAIAAEESTPLVVH